jgi:hypothetical protein
MRGGSVVFHNPARTGTSQRVPTNFRIGEMNDRSMAIVADFSIQELQGFLQRSSRGDVTPRE